MSLEARSTVRQAACHTANDTRAYSTKSAAESENGHRVASQYLATLTLPWRTLATRLDGEDSGAFEAYVLRGIPMPKQTANHVAEQVKRWALENRATFYAHWFHPLTGVPADKHDSFLARGIEPGQALAPIEQLPGSRLLQGEPDASSFPSGGLRSTHAARGYTVWDPTSPMFIRSEGATRTLCIPCAYVSWAGHALDTKTPLLRAKEALSREIPRLLNLAAGADLVRDVISTLGTEQEYFLVDKSFLATRPDLVMTGRTLVGAAPPRGQQLEDHYFGPIPARVQAYIAEVEYELTRLGIPVKTRHCEVAPAQFELAPIFEEVNVACDHNVLTMDVMRRVADRHGLVCLLHEKPFDGINGSGKHNNWSVATSDGENLLEPGPDPAHNTRFLLMLAAVLLAVQTHGDMLRVSIATAGNDFRLGANEAPPAIISVYLGDALDRLLANIEDGRLAFDARPREIQATSQLHTRADLTDRNRTTPFAFTGNKFEFRAVGSGDTPAWPMTVLIAAVASATSEVRRRLEKALERGSDRTGAVHEVVREIFVETRPVRYEGNNYATDWIDEAERRGLPILRNTPAALARMQRSEATRFLVEQQILSEEEVAARCHVYAEKYVKTVEIEASALAEMAATQVLPALDGEIVAAGHTRAELESSGVSAARAVARVRRLAELGDEIYAGLERLAAIRSGLHDKEPAESMRVVGDALVPAMDAVRRAVDAVEVQLDDAKWPFAKYREMLFLGV